MDSASSGRLLGSEIHGFHTLQDLDVANIMEEARSRWLRPNEIHAILCNCKYFTINVKPVNLPKSGTIVLFDRKMLRNFRKDGHNWKKKNDGKTVKEAHEHLKVGNEERIHVYYAHGQDNPTFVRRCYWLLDKTLEHIVLVHYRETQEQVQDSPVTPVNSNSSSVSDQSLPWPLSEESDSAAGRAYYAGEKELLGDPRDSSTMRNHEMRLHEINTLDWDDLVTIDPNNSITSQDDKIPFLDPQDQLPVNATMNHATSLPTHNISPLNNSSNTFITEDANHFSIPSGIYSQAMTCVQEISNPQTTQHSNFTSVDASLSMLANDGLQSQDSFGRWINYVIVDSPGSVDDGLHESSISSDHDSFASPVISQLESSRQEQIFIINDVSPGWAYSAETTKVLVTGNFQERYMHLEKSTIFCVCGDAFIPAEFVQSGVYRCFMSPHSPEVVNFYLSLDGHKPISQVLNFEFRASSPHESIVSLEENSKWEEFQLQMRLTYLLLSTSRSLNILTSKVPPTNVKGAKKFANRTSNIAKSWTYLINSIENNRISFIQAKDGLFELTLKNIVKEWLLERILEGCKTTEHDAQGQGVIHLCAMLGYTWAVYLFSWSGLSLDFRDKHGWTALHWAAYCGREKMVAVLLSAGAKPNLVTDPTKENPGGCQAADLASIKGYDGLAAYLSEKALVAHFEDMSMAGNATGSLQISTTDTTNLKNLTEEEIYLKDTLAAYRTAADAAARIQAAFREHSLKVQTRAVQVSNPEDDARNIIAAMKIQHAYRNYETKKKMAAAARIQYRFRTWKMRREFLSIRQQVIKIQAAFRGFQVRRQHRKIIWSVGVLEKAILRWRLKRKGFRGLHVNRPATEDTDMTQDCDAEEDFYKASRKQAEERVERSVIRVQAMFRSKKAQEEYRRMKLTYNEVKLEYEELLDSENNMGERDEDR